MQPVDYIGLLIQVPLVGIFVWFALQVIKLFTEFLKEQGENNNAAIKAMAERFADEIRVLGKEVAALRQEVER